MRKWGSGGILYAGGCWALLAGFADPRPVLVVDKAVLAPSRELAGARPSTLPYRLDLEEWSAGLDQLAGVPTPAEEIVAQAEKLLLTGRFEEARPMLDQLATMPDMALQSNFMEGYVALEQGDYATAESRLRAAVALRPDFSRAHVELARALMQGGKREEADEHFRIAERDKSLPDEVQQLIRISRRTTADKTRWWLIVDAAAVADSNFSNGTDDSTVSNPRLRSRGGVGESLSARGGLRVRAGDRLSVAVDAEASVNEFEESEWDEVSLLAALGPELSLTSGAASVQALAYERWFGGVVSQRGVGARARYQDEIADGQHIYLYVDTRLFDSDYGEDYSGWQASGLLAYDRALSQQVSLNGTLLVRREWLGSPSVSNTELGAYAGMGALLPLGLRGGLSTGLTHVAFDEPILALSDDPRRDWRWNAGAYLTTRKAIVLGLWPTLSYTYIGTASSIPLYRANRHRVRLNLRREF